jgi:hypothetical protein
VLHTLVVTIENFGNVSMALGETSKYVIEQLPTGVFRKGYDSLNNSMSPILSPGHEKAGNDSFRIRYELNGFAMYHQGHMYSCYYSCGSEFADQL